MIIGPVHLIRNWSPAKEIGYVLATALTLGAVIAWVFHLYPDARCKRMAEILAAGDYQEIRYDNRLNNKAIFIERNGYWIGAYSGMITLSPDQGPVERCKCSPWQYEEIMRYHPSKDIPDKWTRAFE